MKNELNIMVIHQLMALRRSQTIQVNLKQILKIDCIFKSLMKKMNIPYSKLLIHFFSFKIFFKKRYNVIENI